MTITPLMARINFAGADEFVYMGHASPITATMSRAGEDGHIGQSKPVTGTMARADEVAHSCHFSPTTATLSRAVEVDPRHQGVTGAVRSTVRASGGVQR